MSKTDAAYAAAVRRPAKTRKGRKIIQGREGKIEEDPKSCLVIRGNKASNDVVALLRDIYTLRTPLATLFSRRHDTHPFEDIKRVEVLCQKYSHSLFAFGSSSKKRPFRLILGRLFSGELLDMQEFNIADYMPIHKFSGQKRESVLGSKPLLVFQGAAFDNDDRLKRTKSLLIDYFGGPTPQKILLEGVDTVIVCSTFDVAPSGTTGSLAVDTNAPPPPVVFRRFHVKTSKSGSTNPRVELNEVGPRFKLTVDRVRDPEKDRWKAAIKVPKAAKPKKVKNITGDAEGKKRGRLHLGKQDFDQIHTVHHGKAKVRKLTRDLDAAKAKVDQGIQSKADKKK